jgi:hypothetical protein
MTSLRKQTFVAHGRHPYARHKQVNINLRLLRCICDVAYIQDISRNLGRTLQYMMVQKVGITANKCTFWIEITLFLGCFEINMSRHARGKLSNEAISAT